MEGGDGRPSATRAAVTVTAAAAVLVRRHGLIKSSQRRTSSLSESFEVGPAAAPAAAAAETLSVAARGLKAMPGADAQS